MAKKGKNKGAAVMPAEKPKSTTSSSVLNNMFKKSGVTTDEKLVSKLNEEEKKSLHQLTSQLEDLIAVNEKSKKEQEALQQQLDTQLENANSKQKELDSKLSTEKRKEASLKAKETELLSKFEQVTVKEKTLLEKEANAKAGFVLERQESLESLKKEYQQVEQKITQLDEQRRTNELKMLEQQARSLELLKEEESARFSALKEQLIKERINLEKHQQNLEKQIAENTILNEQLKNRLEAQGDWKKQLNEEFRREFQNDKVSLENELKNLELYRSRDQEKMKSLTERLRGYKELEQEAKIQELGSPEAVLERMDQLENDLKEARNKLKGRTEDDLEEELEYYKDKSEELEGGIRDLRQEYDELSMRESKYKLSNRKTIELKKERDLLEASNAALTHSIEAIRSQLDDLVEAQQSQDTFKELMLMDRKYSEPVPAQPIDSLKDFTEDLQHRIAISTDVELYYDLELLRKFIAGLALSPLHVFQGISGTGKTSLVNAFAKAVGGKVTSVRVQAGWRDRDDLIGHYNAFEKRYYEKECLQGIYKAHTPSYSNRFNIILLDEMNLSRPEQYFAEFLSAMEENESERKVVLMDSSITNPPKYFVEDRKLLLKPNTWFMGTANHDETTFEFADKTHDRAFTLDLEKQVKPAGWRAKAVKNSVIDFNSVQALFEKAQKTHSKAIEEMLNKLVSSNFTNTLERQFDIGWGNRLENQAKRFISVYIDCGGKAADALEHMMITRVLRKGKVLGRYDISIEKLEELKTAMKAMFQSVGGEGSKALGIIESEITRKKEGVY
jgi:chromosome segregation ATPase